MISCKTSTKNKAPLMCEWSFIFCVKEKLENNFSGAIAIWTS